MDKNNINYQQEIDWESILKDLECDYTACPKVILNGIDWKKVLEKTTKKKDVNEDNIKESVSIIKYNFPDLDYSDLFFNLYKNRFDNIGGHMLYGLSNINGNGIIISDKNIDTMKYDQPRIQIGDIIKHFKQELIKDDEVLQNKYLYRVTDIAKHTETGEILIIYQALYYPFETFARPQSMFFELVDRDKYPNVNQKYRLEVLKRTNLAE